MAATGFSPLTKTAPPMYLRIHASMVELVDTPDSKSGSARSAGSSPARGTKFLFRKTLHIFSL
jgi:hypothetical protein